MRSSLLAGVLLFVSVATIARADPGDVYNDFATDGRLSCNHPRSDLQAVLRSGSINQYGDPYTVARLKLAVRRELAGGCRGRASSAQGSGTAGERSTTKRTSAPGERHEKSRSANDGSRRRSGDSHALASPETASAGNNRFIWSRIFLAALVVAAVAVVGWVTRRALAGRS